MHDAQPDDLTQERYDRIYQMLIRYFAPRNCPDPENLVGETFIRALPVIQGETTLTCKLETYLYAVAKHVASEKCWRRRVEEESIEDLPSGQQPHVDPELELPLWKQELYHKCLGSCLQTLEPEQRDLPVKYYEGNEEGEMMRNRKVLAEQHGTNPEALGARVRRLRRRLGVCIDHCVKKKQAEEIRQIVINYLRNETNRT